MTSRKMSPTPKKSPMSRLEVEKMRKRMLTLIAKEPRTCSYLAKLFDLSEKTMMNHLQFLHQLSEIHARQATSGRRTRYMWHLGQGEQIVRNCKPKPDATVYQNRVASWPPVTCKKQHIWSALGL